MTNEMKTVENKFGWKSSLYLKVSIYFARQHIEFANKYFIIVQNLCFI